MALIAHALGRKPNLNPKKKKKKNQNKSKVISKAVLQNRIEAHLQQRIDAAAVNGWITVDAHSPALYIRSSTLTVTLNPQTRSILQTLVDELIDFHNDHMSLTLPRVSASLYACLR